MSFLYFDAGMGAMIVQGLVAAAAGILLLSKGVLYKVKSFFFFFKEEEEEDTYDSIDVDDKDTAAHDQGK